MMKDIVNLVFAGGSDPSGDLLEELLDGAESNLAVVQTLVSLGLAEGREEWVRGIAGMALCRAARHFQADWSSVLSGLTFDFAGSLAKDRDHSSACNCMMTMQLLGESGWLIPRGESDRRNLLDLVWVDLITEGPDVPSCGVQLIERLVDVGDPLIVFGIEGIKELSNRVRAERATLSASGLGTDLYLVETFLGPYLV